MTAPVRLIGLTRRTILEDIIAERLRQEELCAQGKFQWTLAHAGQFTLADGLAVLAEEFGEVAKEVCESGFGNGGPPDLDHLRTELVQLAACCVAWVEGIDAYSDDEIEERTHETEEARLARLDRHYDEQGGWHSSPEAALPPPTERSYSAGHNID